MQNKNNKVVQLKSILTYNGLSSGYSFRGKIKADGNGTVKVIQLKNISADYLSIDDNCIYINEKNIKERHYLSNNTILFIAKGVNHFAIPLPKIENVPTIASSVFFVLKINTSIADPDYIAWYINQQKVQNYFKTNRGGTYTMSINKKILEETPIALPNLKKQRVIAKIAQLYHKEQNIYKKIAQLKIATIQHQLLKSL